MKYLTSNFWFLTIYSSNFENLAKTAEKKSATKAPIVFFFFSAESPQKLGVNAKPSVPGHKPKFLRRNNPAAHFLASIA
jgi:hypothetical protein